MEQKTGVFLWGILSMNWGKFQGNPRLESKKTSNRFSNFKTNLNSSLSK
jgi:hypothetical protein